jgi:predicted negative regulator of RcsB-dependent stress response
MEFLEKNIKAIAGAFGLIIVIGIGWAIVSGQNKQKEAAAQEKFAQIESDYTKYKEGQSQLTQMMNMAKNPKDAGKNAAADKKAEAELSATVATSKTKVETDLKQFIDGNTKSIATSMAALYLSEILVADQKSAEALVVLQKVDGQGTDLTSILVQKKIGALLADANQCDAAMKVWDKILKTNAAKFAHSEVKIMQSLCYQKNNDLAKAEEVLNSIKNDKTETSQEYVQHAERILRLIHFKKASGT